MASRDTETKLWALAATELPESIGGIDNREKVDPMNIPPYNWICFLSITAHDGSTWKGSGFKIYLKDVNYTAVITCGHCTHIKGKLAKQISVTFPGQETSTVETKDLYASPEYIGDDPDYDYGLILLPGTSDNGFGWSAIVPDSEMDNRIVISCGYPGDKPIDTLWKTEGPVTKCTDHRIYYMNDTMPGQSGSPVYTSHDGYWTVVGIHSYGGCPNSAVRLIPEMLRRFYTRMNSLKQVTIRSHAFPDVYMRCNGRRVVKPKDNGVGTVNCQHLPARSWEEYYIYPVGMNPSLAPPDSKYPVHILSAYWKNVYIRMDGSKMSKFKGLGGGVVNCQFGASIYEIFYLRKEAGGIFSFQSVQFPHCFLRLDGTGAVINIGPGGGVVNCQYYDNPDAPAQAFERFYIA